MSLLLDRQFFVHAPHTAVGISSGRSAWQPLCRGEQSIAPLKPDTRRRLCLVSGCPSYESDQSLSMLASFLEQHYEVACTKAFSRTRGDLPGLECLARSQSVVFFAQRLAIADQQLDQLRTYFASGGSTVALIGPSGALENWPEWETEVLGVEPAGRIAGSMGAEIEPAPFAEGHPILRGAKGLTHGGSITTYRETDGHVTALLSARLGCRQEPVAWVRTAGRSRAFFTTLGHPTDFRNPAMLQLLANAVLWSSEAKPA